MGKIFDLKAGERRRVLWIFSSSIPGKARFRVETADGSPPKGRVELARRRWFTWHRTEHPLEAHHGFDKGFADSDYRIYVMPETDCRIVFETRHFRAETYFRILGGVLAMGIIAAIASFVFFEPGSPSE